MSELLRTEDERADLCLLGNSDHPVEFGDRPARAEARPGEIRVAWSVSFGDRVPVTAGHRRAKEGTEMCLYRSGAGLVWPDVENNPHCPAWIARRLRLEGWRVGRESSAGWRKLRLDEMETASSQQSSRTTRS